MCEIAEKYSKQELERLQKIVNEKREQVEKKEITRLEYHCFLHGLFKCELEAILNGRINTDLERWVEE